MQSVSQTSRRPLTAVPAATVWSAIMVFALSFTVARSTVAAQWVPAGIDLAPLVALAGAVVMTLFAISRRPAWLCAAASMVGGPAVCVLVTAPQFALLHPDDPSGIAAVQAWMGRVLDGSAFADHDFVAFLITLLMWISGAWLAWCVIRWRQPLIGLVPSTSAFTTNVLNTNNQQGYTYVFLALTLGLLLWTTYTTYVAEAVARRIRTTAEARWDFWETGLVMTAGVLAVGILLPPMTTIDRTQNMQTGAFAAWASLQQKLSRSGLLGNAPGSGQGASTGFSSSVRLGAQLEQSTAPVFTYTVDGLYPGPRYFRGVDLSIIRKGPDGQPEWAYGSATYVSPKIAAYDSPVMHENYLDLAAATFNVDMLAPPAEPNQDILFYPGLLYRTSRVSQAEEVILPPEDPWLATTDRLDALNPSNSRGRYSVTVDYPNVTPEQLSQAGSDHADWLAQYTRLPGDVRSPGVYERILRLAVQLTAGKTNPYDQAKAIEAYLRSGEFIYTLHPGVPPAGTDRLDYFLFHSHEGYCQYFAMAMGEMLRSLGIPTRLVSGFGPGSMDAASRLNVVRDEDAHVWVESYFPRYGWIPFEPTSSYDVIQRGVSNTGLCRNDNNCTVPPASPPAVTASPPRHGAVGHPGNGGGPGGTTKWSPLGFLDAAMITRLLGIAGALLLLLAALALRYLRPRTVTGVWQRVLVLARLAGAELHPGETPNEMDRRLARAFPEAALQLHALTGAFVVAAYAPPEMAQATKPSVMEAWSSLRPLMVRRVLSRARPGRS